MSIVTSRGRALGLGNIRTRNAAISSLQSGRMMVYAARNTDGLIKIGASIDVVERVRHIGGMVEILAVQFGTRADERAIHHALSEHTAHGREYYQPTPQVLAVVNGMRDAFNLPHIAA